MLNLPHWLWADVRLEGWGKNRERLARVGRVASKSLTRLLRSRRANDGADRSIADSMNVSNLPDHIRLTFETNFQAFLQYQPQPYPGALTLFRGKAQPLRSPHSRDLGWRQFVSQVRIVDVPGNHGGLLYPPFVQSLAKRITAELALARTAIAAPRDTHPQQGAAAEGSDASPAPHTASMAS
jgi:thioesterase domain-containing protein